MCHCWDFEVQHMVHDPETTDFPSKTKFASHVFEDVWPVSWVVNVCLDILQIRHSDMRYRLLNQSFRCNKPGPQQKQSETWYFLLGLRLVYATSARSAHVTDSNPSKFAHDTLKLLVHFHSLMLSTSWSIDAAQTAIVSDAISMWMQEAQQYKCYLVPQFLPESV